MLLAPTNATPIPVSLRVEMKTRRSGIASTEGAATEWGVAEGYSSTTARLEDFGSMIVVYADGAFSRGNRCVISGATFTRPAAHKRRNSSMLRCSVQRTYEIG